MSDNAVSVRVLLRITWPPFESWMRPTMEILSASCGLAPVLDPSVTISRILSLVSDVPEVERVERPAAESYKAKVLFVQ